MKKEYIKEESNYDGLKDILNKCIEIPEYFFKNNFEQGPLDFHHIYEHGGFEVEIMHLARDRENKSIIYNRLEHLGKILNNKLYVYNGTEYTKIMGSEDSGKFKVENDILADKEIEDLEKIFASLYKEWKLVDDIKKGKQQVLVFEH